MPTNIKKILSQCLSLSASLFFYFIFILLFSPVSFAADDNQILLEKTINQFLTQDHALSKAEQEKFFTIMDSAVRNGAKLSEINTDSQINNLPIIRICQNIIDKVEKSLSPSLCLNQILSHWIPNVNLMTKPEELIYLTMEKGVNIRQISNTNPRAGDIFNYIYNLLNKFKNSL